VIFFEQESQVKYKLDSANHDYKRWKTKYFSAPSDLHAIRQVLDICHKMRKDYWNAKSIPVTLFGESETEKDEFSRVILVIRTRRNPL